ncbi:unnamed protein product, partial [Protopolystoma xenopodis]
MSVKTAGQKLAGLHQLATSARGTAGVSIIRCGATSLVGTY